MGLAGAVVEVTTASSEGASGGAARRSNYSGSGKERARQQRYDHRWQNQVRGMRIRQRGLRI
jgi:hypothetical protein